jgi:hypothetical protein
VNPFNWTFLFLSSEKRLAALLKIPCARPN